MPRLKKGKLRGNYYTRECQKKKKKKKKKKNVLLIFHAGAMYEIDSSSNLTSIQIQKMAKLKNVTKIN